MGGINNKHTAIGWFIDTLIVLLNIAAGRGNYLLFGILHLHGGVWVIAVVIVLDILYLLLRNNARIDHNLKYSPFVFIFIMLAYNFLNVAIRGFGSVVVILEFLLLWVLFYLILIRQLSSLINNPSVDVKNGVTYMSRGYIWLSMISIIGIFISFIAMSLGIVGVGTRIETDYMEANVMNSGVDYYWSFLSVTLQNTLLRVPFFQEHGIFTGLFHEPHILAQNVFPCLILLLGITKTKIWRYVIVVTAVLIMFFSGSTTNILVTFGCIVVYLLIRFKKTPFVVVVSALLLACLIYLYVVYSDGSFLSFFLDRLDSNNVSQRYSEDLLKYTFSPRTLFGTNFLSSSFMDQTSHNQDIGYIPCLMACIFIFLYFRNTVKLLLSDNSVALSVGFASLYWIMHSAKGGLHLFFQTLPVLIIILQLFVINYYGRARTAKNNI